jgi:hypothetical protein
VRHKVQSLRLLLLLAPALPRWVTTLLLLHRWPRPLLLLLLLLLASQLLLLHQQSCILLWQTPLTMGLGLRGGGLWLLWRRLTSTVRPP